MCPPESIFSVRADPCVSRPESLSDIIKWFKTMTTNEYIRNVKDKNWKPFNRQLWQRSFYDPGLRKDEDLIKVAEYIVSNPVRKGLVEDWKAYPFKGSTIYDFDQW